MNKLRAFDESISIEKAYLMSASFVIVVAVLHVLMGW